MRLGPKASPWRLKLEGTRRKNITDYYASREYLQNETMITYKESVGLQYTKFTEDVYKKFDIELALPISYSHQSPAYLKVDAFWSKSFKLIEDKLKAVV